MIEASRPEVVKPMRDQRLWRYADSLTRGLSLIRLKPYDVSTPGGRAQERHRRIALTALASAAARGIGVATSLISVPLTLHYLGVERYGLWMTISSVIAMLGFADLGLAGREAAQMKQTE